MNTLKKIAAWAIYISINSVLWIVVTSLVVAVFFFVSSIAAEFGMTIYENCRPLLIFLAWAVGAASLFAGLMYLYRWAEDVLGKKKKEK